MFEESLVNDTARTARPYAISFSLFLQLGLAAGAIAYPLLHIEALPFVKLRAPSPYRDPIMLVDPAPAQQTQSRPSNAPSIRPEFHIREHRFLPDATASLSAPAIDFSDLPSGLQADPGPSVPGAIPGGPGGGGQITANRPVERRLEKPQPVAVVHNKPVTVGGDVRAPQLLQEIKPAYPPLAKQTRTQGTVRIEAIIGRDGIVRDAHVVSGHPLLVAAALDAVRQWRYRPTILNGQPVEVALLLEVNFRLSQ